MGRDSGERRDESSARIGERFVGVGGRRATGEAAFVSDLRGILTNGLAAPVITNANYSGSVRTSLKLIPPVLSGAKGASRLAADWPVGMTRKCPNMASYLISPLAMGRLPLSWNARNVITTSVTVYSINPNSRNLPFVGCWLLAVVR